MRPEITVLMSVYNGEQWLGESIESILRQTYWDFEFLIVNDGSTDSSINIIEKYAETDSRIVVVDKPNTGLADSLNIGIQMAQGIWIARIDADDISLPDRLQKQLDAVRKFDNCVLVGSGISLIDEHGLILQTYLYPSKHSSLRGRLIRLGPFFAHSSAFYHAETVRSVGCYRGSIYRAEDYDLWLRLVEVGKIACIGEPLVLVRQHSGQISHDSDGERQIVDSYVAVVSYWLRHLGVTDPVVGSEDEFDVFYRWICARLNSERVFPYFRFVNKLKELIGSGYPNIKFCQAALIIIRNPFFVMRWIKFRLTGSRLPFKLASQWSRQFYE